MAENPTASGAGSANDAKVITKKAIDPNDVGELEAALAAARARDEAAAPERRIDAARRRVETARQELEDAEEGLELVIAEEADRAEEDEAGRQAKAERRAAAEALEADEQEGN